MKLGGTSRKISLVPRASGFSAFERVRAAEMPLMGRKVPEFDREDIREVSLNVRDHRRAIRIATLYGLLRETGLRLNKGPRCAAQLNSGHRQVPYFTRYPPISLLKIHATTSPISNSVET